jgi:hypothetical protein
VATEVDVDHYRRLEAELKRTQTALEITGKVHALLEAISESEDTEARLKP